MNNADIKRTINGLHEIAKELEAIEARIQELVEQPEDEEAEDTTRQLEEIRKQGVNQWMEQAGGNRREHIAKSLRDMATEKLDFFDLEEPFNAIIWRVLYAANLFEAHGMLAGIYDPDSEEDQTLHDLLG